LTVGSEYVAIGPMVLVLVLNLVVLLTSLGVVNNLVDGQLVDYTPTYETLTHHKTKTLHGRPEYKI